MPSRLEIELTSQRPDGSWTWRAAGAKQPKGELDGSILPDGAAVGDVLRAEAEILIDGIDVLSVQGPKAARKEPETIKLIGSGREEPLVTTQLAPKGRGDRKRGERRDRGDRGDRDGRGPRDRDRGGRGDRGDRGDRGGRPGGDRGRSDRPRGPRPDPVPERPRPKRLRPGRTHRNAVLAEVPVEQQAIAEQLLKGGLPAVREAIAEQNKQAKAAGQPEVPAGQVMTMAEQLQPKLREAEWRDRAEAALAGMDELDLRDLRSVVVAGDGIARDESARSMQEQLKTGLNRRVDAEMQLWVGDIEANLSAGRFVRALRLSSRPPKAGAPVPKELGERLAASVSEGLNERTNQELWAASLDALSVSPVRSQVTITSKPAEPSAELLEAVRRVAEHLPEIAKLFGVDPSEAKAARKRRPPRTQRPKPSAPTPPRPGSRPAPGAQAAKDDAPTARSDAEEAAAPSSDATGGESVAETAQPDTQVAESVAVTDTPADTPAETPAETTATPSDAEPTADEPSGSADEESEQIDGAVEDDA